MILTSEGGKGNLYLGGALQRTSLTEDEIRIVREWVNGPDGIFEDVLISWLKEHWK